MLEVLASFADDDSRRGESETATKPSFQVHIHQCPDCEKPKVQTSRGELEIGQAELEQVQCDCQVSRPNERNTTSIAPATRRFVLARARHKCERPGCSHTQFLEVHHKVPRSRGGVNSPDNLVVVCSACHRLLHNHETTKSVFRVKSPQATYSWRSETFSPDDCCSNFLIGHPKKTLHQPG